MEFANPWLYYPALVTSPIWAAVLCAGFFKAYDRLALMVHEWLGGRR